MRFSRVGKTLICLALVTALLAPAGASAAGRNQPGGLFPVPGRVVWDWLGKLLGVPLRVAGARSEAHPAGLDQGPGIDPMGGQAPNAGNGADPNPSQGLDEGSGIDPMGGH